MNSDSLTQRTGAHVRDVLKVSSPRVSSACSIHGGFKKRAKGAWTALSARFGKWGGPTRGQSCPRSFLNPPCMRLKEQEQNNSLPEQPWSVRQTFSDAFYSGHAADWRRLLVVAS